MSWSRHVALVLLSSACQAIPRTEPGWPREELEVVVNVDPEIARLLKQEEGSVKVAGVISEAVLELADIGLRFYPVPSEHYGEEQIHPPFLLRVDVRELGAVLAPPAAPPKTEWRAEKALASVHSTVVATLVKRRGEGPPLIVAKSVGHGTVKATEAAAAVTSTAEFELEYFETASNPPRLSSDDLLASVRAAVRGALRQLVEPVDRELGAR
jgi:hypothetical protein